MKGRRGSIAAGGLLILLGLTLLAVRLVPGLQATWFSWPLGIVGVGVFLLILGLVTGAPGLAVPAANVGGIGALLYWQNLTGRWDTWSFAWTLIPGFVGVGLVLAGLLGERPRETVRAGTVLLVISAALFLIFGSFLGGLQLLGPYWPVLLIGLGVVLLLLRLLPRSRR